MKEDFFFFLNCLTHIKKTFGRQLRIILDAQDINLLMSLVFGASSNQTNESKAVIGPSQDKFEKIYIHI